jgi:stearoyl-CoA desaturase (Delta-9 desaturase)
VTYLAVGHGITIGFHRLLSHRAFVARRPLKLALVALGSMAFQGGPISWVDTHRRHHVFADADGDPHSPRRLGPGVAGTLRGLWHSHLGWLFTDRGESRQRAADLLADRDMVVMDALFPLFCVASLAVPFLSGWALGGTVGAGLSALLWAGLVRVFLLQHITWTVNSLGHTVGRRPFDTADRSSNVAALALISMGDSWHNGHHAFPRSARHGLLGHQWDTSARLIDSFRRLGWADDVRRPDRNSVVAHRRTTR